MRTTEPDQPAQVYRIYGQRISGKPIKPDRKNVSFTAYADNKGSDQPT